MNLRERLRGFSIEMYSKMIGYELPVEFEDDTSMIYTMEKKELEK